MKTNYGTDWKNINLDSGYERDLDILDSYDFATLLLEVECNLREINKETVSKHFEAILKEKVRSAREVFNNNLNNIVKNAVESRNKK